MLSSPFGARVSTGSSKINNAEVECDRSNVTIAASSQLHALCGTNNRHGRTFDFWVWTFTGPGYARHLYRLRVLYCIDATLWPPTGSEASDID